jgi:3-phenylpropionate/cinnamic acid dioxygenase small subunit
VTDGEVDRATREDVGDVLIRYATGIDQRDWDLFRTCFTDDVLADYGEIGVWHGVDEITDWMEKTHAPFGHTMHRITNAAVWPRTGGVASRSYVHVVIRDAGSGHGVQGYGIYDDELVSTADGWRIARRRFTMVHQHAD